MHSWTIWMAMDPSPTAEATRFTEPCLMSPVAKTPGSTITSHPTTPPMAQMTRVRRLTGTSSDKNRLVTKRRTSPTMALAMSLPMSRMPLVVP